MGKKRDFIISLFLMGSLALTAFFVSCSEENGFLIGPGSNSNNGNPTYIGDTEGSFISSTFKTIGEGAASEVGGQLAGWALGALGLAGNSPDYTNQLNQIIDELEEINTLLQNIDGELITINQTLTEMNCGNQTASIQNQVGALIELYDQYNGFIGDTLIDTSIVTAWANKVINGSNQSQSVGEILSTIQSNIGVPSGALVSCLKVIPQPGNLTLGLDTLYYNNANAIVNYYYYYQLIGLAMLSDAYHYNAWREAGSPNSQTYSADSIQAVCGYNSTTQYYCNEVEIHTNQLYNTLITQLTFAGAGYTDDYLIFQQSYSNPKAWIRSLEDFTSEAGFNCSSPLTNSNPCGPAAVYYSDNLSVTTYRNTPGFQFGNHTELDSLVMGDSVHNKNITAGAYLESHGFKNMSNKTFIATGVSSVTLSWSNMSISFVPFFTTDATAVKTNNGEYKCVIFGSNGFNTILKSSSEVDGECVDGHYTYVYYKVKYSNPYSAIYNADSWLKGWAYTGNCNTGNNPQFHFTGSDYNPSTGNFPGDNQYLPGYLEYAQANQIVPKRYRMIMLETNDATCTNGRGTVNNAGMPMICGNDFTEFLNVNVPKPPTCKNSSITPPCTDLQ